VSLGVVACVFVRGFLCRVHTYVFAVLRVPSPWVGVCGWMGVEDIPFTAWAWLRLGTPAWWVGVLQGARRGQDGTLWTGLRRATRPLLRGGGGTAAAAQPLPSLECCECPFRGCGVGRGVVCREWRRGG
jgi:hypothetical protein